MCESLQEKCLGPVHLYTHCHTVLSIFQELSGLHVLITLTQTQIESRAWSSLAADLRKASIGHDELRPVPNRASEGVGVLHLIVFLISYSFQSTHAHARAVQFIGQESTACARLTRDQSRADLSYGANNHRRWHNCLPDHQASDSPLSWGCEACRCP